MSDWANEIAIRCTFIDHRVHNTATALRKAKADGMREAATFVGGDVDWTRFGKPITDPWEGGTDALREYRLGIAVGRVMSAQLIQRAARIERGDDA